MKKKALIAAVLAATTLTATTAFAAQNPFKDLPEGHWAYDAVTMLAQDGVIDGYGDGNFNGDKLMNRYEMAEIVSKAMAKYDGARPQDKGAIKKLEQEFGAELKDMDVRLKGVEEDVKDLKKGQSSFKMYGDARIRYFRNQTGTRYTDVHSGLADNDRKNTMKDNKRTEKRIRLGLYAEPVPNMTVIGQIKADDTNDKRQDEENAASSSTHNALTMNRLEMNWKAPNGFKIDAGRMWKNLGQGLLWWENGIDGCSVEKDFAGGKANVMVGVGDLAAEDWSDNTEYGFFANAKVKVSPAVNVTAAYLQAHSDKNINNTHISTWPTWKGLKNDGTYYTNYELGLMSLGLQAQLSPKWSIIAEGTHNAKTPDVTYGTDAVAKPQHKNGFWTRLGYGKLDWSKANTWQIYGEYFALGNLAIDSSGWGHRLNIAGGNGYGGDGARGWGLGISRMVADNTNIELTYYQMKPFDSAAAGFDKYKDMGYLSLNYSF